LKVISKVTALNRDLQNVTDVFTMSGETRLCCTVCSACVALRDPYCSWLSSGHCAQSRNGYIPFDAVITIIFKHLEHFKGVSKISYKSGLEWPMTINLGAERKQNGRATQLVLLSYYRPIILVEKWKHQRCRLLPQMFVCHTCALCWSHWTDWDAIRQGHLCGPMYQGTRFLRKKGTVALQIEAKPSHIPECASV